MDLMSGDSCDYRAWHQFVVYARFSSGKRQRVTSDVFEVERQGSSPTASPRAAASRTPSRRADDPDYFREAFFVPPPGRRENIRDNLHHQVGDGLNKVARRAHEAGGRSITSPAYYWSIGQDLRLISLARIAGTTRS